MARAALTVTEQVSLPSNGLNLTDATFATLATGANNGVTFAYDGDDWIVLRNSTAGAAAFTIKVPVSVSLTAIGSTSTDVTITVAAAKDHIFKLPTIFKQTDGNIYIDCDIAGKVLVING